MIIIGYNGHSPHDGSIAVIRDGKILFSLANERLNGEKHIKGVSLRVVTYALKKCNLSLSEVVEEPTNYY